MAITPAPSDFDGIRDEVLRLRCLGYGQDRIAKELRISKSRVATILRSEFVDRFAGREELKQKTALELEGLMRPLKLRYEQNPTRQDAETILKIIDRTIRLFALDEAMKVEVKHLEDLSEEEIRQELARYGVVVQKDKPALPPATPIDAIPEAEIIQREYENLQE